MDLGSVLEVLGQRRVVSTAIAASWGWEKGMSSAAPSGDLQRHLQHGSEHPNARVHLLTCREPGGFHSQASPRLYELFSAPLPVTPATAKQMGEMLLP